MAIGIDESEPKIVDKPMDSAPVRFDRCGNEQLRELIVELKPRDTRDLVGVAMLVSRAVDLDALLALASIVRFHS